VEIQYRRGVQEEGNRKAQEVMARGFSPRMWNGADRVHPGTGLAFRRNWPGFDAARTFDLPRVQSRKIRAAAAERFCGGSSGRGNVDCSLKPARPRTRGPVHGFFRRVVRCGL